MIATEMPVKLNAEEEAREDIRQLADVIEYLDTHDIGDELEAMPEVHFEINLPPRKAYFTLEAVLAAKLREVARQRGVAAEALLNEWVREKVTELAAVGATG